MAESPFSLGPSRGADLKRLAASVVADNGLAADQAAIAVQTVCRVMDSAIWQRALASSQRFVEVPFQTQLAPDEPSKDRLPTLLRGVIDLVFVEEQGWVIVDYKTDRVAVGTVPGLTQHYAPQIRLYAKVWRDLTGQEVQEMGLFFTHPGCYVKV